MVEFDIGDKMQNDELEKQRLAKEKKRRLIIQIILITIVLLVAIVGTILLFPIFIKIQNDEVYRNQVINYLNGWGSWSWIAIIGIQILQTVLCVIPAGPIVIITGVLYSPLKAAIITVVGQTLGALVVIGLVKLFGHGFLTLFIDPKQTEKFTILKDRKRCCVLMFSYLLIPVLPKDPIAFVVPFTEVKVRDFIIINIIARLPMTLVSVYFGSNILGGSLSLGFYIGCGIAIIAIICFIFNKQITEFIDKITSPKKGETTDKK